MDTDLQNNRDLILERRAEKLASIKNSSEVSTETVSHVIFRLSNEIYAMNSHFVLEVHPFLDITLLPGAPPFVYGLINVRRKIVCVIDLKSIFQIDAQEGYESNKVIVLEESETGIGIMVDEVLGVRQLDINKIRSCPASFSGHGKRFTKGVIEENLIVLDGHNLVNDEMFTFNTHVQRRDL